MPSKSEKQHMLMEAIGHGAKPKSGKGPPVAVAKEFIKADKGKKTFKKPSPIGSKSTPNTIKDPRSLVGFSPR